MADTTIEAMKRHVGFDEQDAANIRALGLQVEALLPPTLDRFCDEILRQPGIRTVLSDGAAQVGQLRETLAKWLHELFRGTYDDAYWTARTAIGHAHARAGLPRHHMLAAIEVIWEELERGIRQLGLVNESAKLISLHKLLMIELAVMLDSYHESYTKHIRQVEREAVQERLTEAEHLAQIGQLAASLAHEIKNPLAGISGAIQVIRDSMKAADSHRPILDEILRQVSRLDGTVKDLLVYARPKPPRFRKVKLHELIVGALTVLREQPEMQRVRFEYVNSQKLPPIEADENQLEQLLTNLLLNAAQAASDDGLVRLITTARPDGVRLTVEDRGHGMNEEVRRRALEPFFTTKAKGTGLGLSICRKIAETHGGKIDVHSVVGEGTEVVVDLPRQQPASGGSVDDDPRPDR
jgi:signal transduction histidine kinase